MITKMTLMVKDNKCTVHNIQYTTFPCSKVNSGSW